MNVKSSYSLTPGQPALCLASYGNLALAQCRRPRTDINERAGHGVHVVPRVNAACIDVGETVSNQRIEETLND